MQREATHFDVLIRGGTIIDGSRSPRFQGDVGINGSLIAAIGDLSDDEADLVIDASDRIVAPGFVDSHTHDDGAVLSQPDMSFKISQGVTTVIIGNCGVSMAPVFENARLTESLGLFAGDSDRPFASLRAYLNAVRERAPSVNVAALIGHSTLRLATMDDLERSANSAEIAAMQALLEEALSAGALGVSTGTYYPAAAHASIEEIIEVCQPLIGTGALYATHMRDEADKSMESLEETFRIGRALDCPVLISHHKLQRAQNHGKSRVTLGRIAEAMRSQCVCLDCYPYDASSTMLHRNSDRLQGRVVIATSASHPDAVGRELAELAAEWQVSLEEASARLQPATAIYFSMDESDVRNILAFEDTMIGSDGLPTGQKPHPRLWGTFPRVLGHYCRDVGLFNLETAVWKMTGLTANNFNLEGRGRLVPGHAADVVIFDAMTIRDRATYENPTQAAVGIEAVIVNGFLTWRNGRHLGARAGQVITRSIRPAGPTNPVPIPVPMAGAIAQGLPD